MKYIKTILISLVPSFFIFLGKNTYLFNQFKESELFGFTKTTDIENVQFYYFLFGILWVGIIYPARYIYIKTKFDKTSEIYSELIEYNKNILFKYPQIQYKSLNVKFNTRIFVPKKNILELFKNSTTLISKEYEGLTNKLENKKLNFCVNGDCVEGMVGQSFKEKEIFMDFDMSDHNKYNLSENQKRLVRNVKFCSTIPILDNNSNSIAVLSVDSDQKIKRTNNIENIWKEHLTEYASFVTKHIKI